MIRVEVEPDATGEKYVLRVRDENGEILLSSTSQGYNHAVDAEGIARRLLVGVESIELRTRLINGEVRAVSLR